MSEIWAFISRFFEQFAKSPLGLRAYFIFAIVVTLYECSMVWAPFELKMILVPFTGQLTTIGYSYTLFFAGYLIYSQNWKLRWGIIVPLILISVFGLLRILGQKELSEAFLEAIPYLKASVLQPIWTIAIPLIWVVVITSRSVKDFYSMSTEVEAT